MANGFTDPMLREEARRHARSQRKKGKLTREEVRARERRQAKAAERRQAKNMRGYYDPHRIARYSGMKGNRPPNTKEIQRMLKKKGYDIGPVDGDYGPRTKSAYNAYANGRGSKRWNSRHQRPKPGGGGGAGAGARGGGGGGGHGHGGGGGGGGRGRGGGIGGLGDADVGQMINDAILAQGPRPIGRQFADEMAGLEYDPQLHDVGLRIGRQQRDSAQAERDVGDWYGTAMNAQREGAAANVRANEAAVGGQHAAVQQIIASLGGEANLGSGLVGAQGAGDEATLRAMGLAQQNYDTALTPLLEAEKATQLTNQRRRGQSALQELEHERTSLRGQRGQKKASNLFDIRRYNNEIFDKTVDRKLTIRQYNNQLRQQRFSNRMAQQEAALAAEMTGAQIGALGEQTRASRQQAQGGFTPWMKLDPSQKQDLISAAIANVVDAEGGLVMSPKDAWRTASQYLEAQGFTSIRKKNKARKQMQGFLDAAIRRAMSVNQRRAEQG